MEKSYLSGGMCVLKKCWSAEDVEKKKLAETLKSVQVIGEMAFMSNRNLPETLYIPSNVLVIKKRAFSHCKNLKNVIIAGNNVVIEEWAFEGCENLEKVNFECAKKIGAHAFHGCKKLEERRLKDGVKVGAYAFKGVPSMESAEIPGQDYIIDSTSRYFEPKPVKVEEPKTDAELLSYIQKMMKTASLPLNDKDYERANKLISKMMEDVKSDEKKS